MPNHNSIEIEESPAASIPLNQGEEKHAALLELDKALRQESQIAALEAQVAKLTGQQNPMFKMKEGPGAVKRRQILQDKVKELHGLTRKNGDKWEGPCAPFTIVNFNPVKLALMGELHDQTVPAAGAPSSKTIRFPYNGRSFVGSFVTFRNAKVWPVVIGTENIHGEDVPSIRADYLTPMGIAHTFFQYYVEGAANALGMGGLLIFEGDAHTLANKRTDRSGGTLWVPSIDPETSTPIKPAYKVEERPLTDLLSECFRRQRVYAEAIIAQGHGFYHSANVEEQKQKTDYHVLWHNWAIERGYKTTPEEWASQQLSDSAEVQVVLCPGCSTRQTRADQHFCSQCNAPFDAFKSYMAGMPVPEVWLSRYEGEQWDKIVAESDRRKKKAALLEGEAPKKPKA